YASPEQVRGGPITTASDLYSLGVLLYRLLSGHSPNRVSTTSASELERAICEEEPEKPSLVISKPLAEPDKETWSIPEGTPSKLRRRLEGDLDNIVLMALHKEPQR